MSTSFIIPEIKFMAKPNTLCLYSAIHDIMDFYKVPLTHIDLFFLGNGLDIAYQSDINFLGYLHMEKIIGTLRKELLFPTTYQYHSGSGEELSAQAYDMLSQGHPVLLLVGTSHLTYHPAFHALNNENRGHCNILYGVNSQEKRAYIGDAYFRDSTGKIITFQGIVPYQEINESIFGLLGFHPNQNPDIPRSLIIKKAIENMDAFLKGRFEDGRYYGNLALKQYIKDWDKLSEFEGEQLIRTCYNIHYSLKVRSIFIIIESCINFLQAHSLSASSERHILLNRFEQIKKSWDQIGMSIVKMGLTQRKNSLQPIIANCERLVQEQDETLQQFIESCQSIA